MHSWAHIHIEPWLCCFRDFHLLWDELLRNQSRGRATVIPLMTSERVESFCKLSPSTQTCRAEGYLTRHTPDTCGHSCYRFFGSRLMSKILWYPACIALHWLYYMSFIYVVIYSIFVRGLTPVPRGCCGLLCDSIIGYTGGSDAAGRASISEAYWVVSGWVWSPQIFMLYIESFFWGDFSCIFMFIY